MRILGLESSSLRGSVALLEGERCVQHLHHEQPGAHAEQLLPLVQRALENAQWDRDSIDRIAVGTGPGSFTGLRVGLALAQGLAMGINAELVGVPSLQAMAAAARSVAPLPPSAVLCPLLDARKSELFVAVYDAQLRRQLGPMTIPAASAEENLRRHLGVASFHVCGQIASAHFPENLVIRGNGELPSAEWTARLGAESRATEAVLPEYVRPPDAIRPILPPNPLASDDGH